MSDQLGLGLKKRRRLNEFNEWHPASNDMQGFPDPFRIVVHRRPNELGFLWSGSSSKSSDLPQSSPQFPPSNLLPTQNRPPKFQLFQNGEASRQQKQQQQQKNTPSNNSLPQLQQLSPSNNAINNFSNGMKATVPTSNRRFSMIPQQQQMQQSSQQQSLDHFMKQPPSNSSTQPPTRLSQRPVNINTLPFNGPNYDSMASLGGNPPTSIWSHADTIAIKTEILSIPSQEAMSKSANNVMTKKEMRPKSSSPMSINSESTDAPTPSSSTCSPLSSPPSTITTTTTTTPTHPSPPTTGNCRGTAASGSEKSKKKCPFQPNHLRTALMPTLDKLIRQHPESVPFKQPVDPTALGIPDYFDIIKKPMDLSTIRRKLEQGVYRDPWEYIHDVWLMFDNAWLYNRKPTKVYRYCTKLAEVFEVEIDPVMQSLGYCCGRRYVFNPQTLCCYGKNCKQLCTISRDAKYYSYQNRYTYCQKCFKEIQEDTVTIGDDPTQPEASIKKEQFVEMKNDHLQLEPFVECQECGRNLHQICVLHMDSIWSQGFTCDNCVKQNNTKRKENKFNAKRLSTTKLGMYIETRVNNFLKKKEAGAGEVYIRVVSSYDKIVEVKPEMKNRFVESGDLHDTFPYRAKALFAFQHVDGMDACFFGMHVQEYGSACPAPNTRRVYISYLDSVHFFKPRQLRTAVYHEILLGYLEYVKQLGYTMAHIWACPPSEGDDYIFYCHPQDQKVPKPKRLQEWYKKMLDKGIRENIVLDYKDIFKQAKEDNLTSVAELAYFEGDFWPNVIEDSIKELDQEEKRRQAAAAAASTDEMEVAGDGKNNGQRKAKKSNKSKVNQRKNSKKSIAPQTENDLSTKIFATMEKHKDVFFVIKLHSAQSAASLGTIQDPDPCLTCDLMDGRDAFLTLAKEKYCEFSSLRRVKFSTMVMLYELHIQGQDRFVYTCNHCKNHVETRYHCTVCDDFDLCVGCFQKRGHRHPHKMDKLGFDLDDGSSASPGNQNQGNPKEARELSIQRCLDSLVHTCQCRDDNCRLFSCHKMKRVVGHAKVCKRKSNGGCPICKQLISLCCYHAKHCQEPKCLVPFCANFHHKLRQQQAHQRLQQSQLLRRRMQVMMTQMDDSSTSTSPTPTAVPQQPLPGPPMDNLGGGKPDGGVPLAAFQATRQVQEEEVRQAIAPTSMAAVSQQRQKPHQRSSGGHPQQNTITQQQQQGLNICQQGQPVGPETGRMMLDKFLKILHSPETVKQQQEALKILVKEPKLVTACILRRQQMETARQQQKQ